ncbi:MAG TPA: hypothetical protein VNM37_14600 [Candidatus Dormibacteraeota bacterium]|nr:hypothetical protein [Candidatus Dormibacteraeota bacterium]
MAALGLYRQIQLSWTTPAQRDLAHIAVFASMTNDRSTATQIAAVPARADRNQIWMHTDLTPGQTWYYWLRAVDTTGNASGFFPTSPTAGWSATVTGIPTADGLILLASIEVTSTSQAMLTRYQYVANNASLVTLTLPTTAAVGDPLEIVGKGAGKWRIAQAASQQVHVGSQSTTVGTGGSVTARSRYQGIQLRCVVTNLEWEAI